MTLKYFWWMLNILYLRLYSQAHVVLFLTTSLLIPWWCITDSWRTVFEGSSFIVSSVALIYCSSEYVISKSVFHSYRCLSKVALMTFWLKTKWTAQSGELLIRDNFHVSVLFEGIQCSCVHGYVFHHYGSSWNVFTIKKINCA